MTFDSPDGDGDARPAIRSAERAYWTLRAAILSGELAPGTRLREAALAERLGVSRTPVREALRRLAEAGLVDALPNRGALVAEWSDEDLEEVFAITCLLQAYGARLAASRITDEALGRLHAIVDAAAELARTQPFGYAEQIWALDSDFHNTIVAIGGNRALLALVSGVLEVPQTPAGARRDSLDRILRSIAYHREIVSALEQRDPDWAEAATRANFRASWAALTRAPDEGPPATED